MLPLSAWRDACQRFPRATPLTVTGYFADSLPGQISIDARWAGV